MEMFSDFIFRILKNNNGNGWYYELYSGDASVLIHQSNESFETEGIARYAAIGHITSIETEFKNSECVHS